MPRATRAVSRKDFLRLSGAGLAGAVLLGTTGCGGHATQQLSERSGAAVAHPTDSSPLILSSYPFCHDTTLQHHRLLDLKANVRRFVS
jgi:hypothetical protein